MKCLCGFKQKPDNIVILKHHLEDCLTTGALKEMHPEPHVVWRSNEFTVVAELDEGEAPMEIGIEIKRGDAARKRLEDKILKRESTVQAAVQNFDTPEEIVAVLEGAEVVEEEIVTEEKKPAPKKKAAPKKNPASESK